MGATSSTKAPQGRLGNIQILRAVAATMVVFLHAQHLGIDNPSFRNPAFVPFNLLSLGAGVDIFFLISGFIITLSSMQLVREKNISSFVSKRLKRILPPYYICLSIWVLFIVIKAVFLQDPEAIAKITPHNILSSFLFWPADTMGYGAAYPFPLLDLGWTLNYEMFFYVVFAGCMLAGPKQCFLWLGTIFVAIVIAGQMMPGLPLPFSFWAQPIVLEFLGGVALALLYNSGFRIGPIVQAILIGAGLLIWIFIRESHFGPIPLEAKGSYSWPRVLSAGLGGAFIITGAALGRVQWQGAIARLGIRLGDSSYALYLTHAITFSALRIMLEKAPFAVRWSWPWTIGIVLIAIIAAHIFHLIIEQPIANWLNGRSAWPRVRPPLTEVEPR